MGAADLVNFSGIACLFKTYLSVLFAATGRNYRQKPSFTAALLSLPVDVISAQGFVIAPGPTHSKRLTENESQQSSHCRLTES
jgi:hypothetical protein